MYSFDIVGYTHSSGTIFCTHCMDETTLDPGNESGFVQPVFAGDEWDYIPVCDECGEEIDVTTIEEE